MTQYIDRNMIEKLFVLVNFDVVSQVEDIEDIMGWDEVEPRER